MTILVRNKLLILTGPTGIGKTNLSFEIQSILGCRIISADSRQVYREMKIGTAKPEPDEIAKYKIVLCDHISIHENYNTGLFAKDARKLLEEEYSIRSYGFLCGGTGLYIKALTEGLDAFPDVDPVLVKKWDDRYRMEGIGVLQDALRKKDPEYAEKAEMKNPHRLIRALSVMDQSGLPFSYFLNKSKTKLAADLIYVVLDMDRQALYKKINDRVDRMFEDGLVEEARSLYQHKSLKALQTVGYQELFDYFDGFITLDEAREKIKTHTRQYAKRQLTWLRKYAPGPRFHQKNKQAVLEYVRSQLDL